MKYFLIAMFLVVASACSFTVQDPRTPEVAAATQTARAESLLPTVTPTPVPCVIKGNINRKGEKIFHVPGQANYNNVIAEAMFCTEIDAVAAGFRKAQR